MLYRLSYVGKTHQTQPLERVMGIEPTSSAWKAEVLPLNYTRIVILRSPFPILLTLTRINDLDCPQKRPKMVEGGGFEPPKAEPADLQSAPFGRSGTPPTSKTANFLILASNCQQKSGVIQDFCGLLT